MSETTLPPGWTSLPLAQAGVWRGGGTPSKARPEFWQGDLPWVSPKDMKATQIHDAEDHITLDAVAASSTNVVPAGSVLVVARSGILQHTLPVAVTMRDVALNQDMKALVPAPYVVPEFLAYALRGFADDILRECTKEGTTVQSLVFDRFLSFEAPLAPLNEQRRIAAKLDALLARSRKAREHLDRIPALLDALKRSILAAAFRGDLTADWRKANPDVEPATKLLERIRAERRRRWEEELRAKGKDPKKAKYEEPAPVDESELPELPEGWCWASLGELSRIQGGIQKQPSRAPRQNAYAFLRVANIQRGRTVLDDVHTIELFDGELERLRLERGDLLIVEGNGSESEIGRMAVWGGEVPDCVHQNHLIRVRLNPHLDPQVVEAFWNSPVGIEQVVASAVTTAGLFNLSVKKVAQLPLPVIPAPEAQELRRRIGRLLARHEDLLRMQRQLSAARDRLDAATLQAAFRGELVQQDPHDEPADAMLARLRAATPVTSAKAPRPAPRAKRPASAPPEPASSMGDALDVVVGALVAAKRMTAEQVRAATGLRKDDVTPVLKGLVAAGKVRVEGKARGTAYVWAG